MAGNVKYIQCLGCKKTYVAYSMKNGNKGGNREICRSCTHKKKIKDAFK